MTLFADWPLHNEPNFWGTPAGAGVSGQSLRRFTVARDCGHYTRAHEGKPPPIEWCGLCNEWRGVIVSEAL